MWRSSLRVGLFVGLGALGCETSTRHDPVDEQPSPSLLEPEPLPELPVAVAGCSVLSSKPACLRLPGAPDKPGKPVHLWIAGDWDPNFTVLHDGRALAPDHVVIEPDVDGTWIELRAPQPGQIALYYPEYRTFELEIGLLSNHFISTFDEMYKQKDPDVARRTMERAQPELDQREQFFLECTLSRRLPPPQALAVLANLRAQAEKVDELRCVADLTAQIIDAAMRDEDVEQADAHLAQVREHQQLDLIARINVEYYAAVVAEDNGLLGDAHRGFDLAARLAERVGARKQHAAALIEQALLLARMGRFGEATPIAEQAVAVADSNVAPDIRLNKAWLDVLRRARDPRVADPSPELRELLDAFTNDPRRATIARLNLAVATLQSGDHRLAAKELKLVAPEQLDQRQLLYYELTRFRIALAALEPSLARARLDRADLLAEVIHDSEFQPELFEARVDLELHEGNEDAALDTFERAEQLADALALQVPANDGRSSFWTTLTRSRARHIELALATDDPERALCGVLGARARHLRALATGLARDLEDPQRSTQYRQLLTEYRTLQRALEQKRGEEWKLSGDDLEAFAQEQARDRRKLDELLEQAMHVREQELPIWRCPDVRPTAPGEALLTAYPSADGKSWWFFLDHAGEVAWIRQADDEDRTMLATRAVEQFAERGQLDAVTDLLVIPLGGLLAVDFHTLAPLMRPGGPRVRHGLGLGRTSTASNSSGLAAILGDGSANLSNVANELAEVRNLLAARGWDLTASWDPAEEQQPRLLHYAGHGEHTGLAGWDSALDLPDGRQVTSERLLIERRAPNFVVLGACDAGAVDPTMLDGGMNVAVAMLLAGSQLVIAPNRKVDDRDAHALAQELYAALPDLAAVNANVLVDALTEAQRDDPRFHAWHAWVP
jgi:predicted negative regulator of RcsB-dependent stress response